MITKVVYRTGRRLLLVGGYYSYRLRLVVDSHGYVPRQGDTTRDLTRSAMMLGSESLNLITSEEKGQWSFPCGKESDATCQVHMAYNVKATDIASLAP
jgi:hypothetical protein